MPLVVAKIEGAGQVIFRVGWAGGRWRAGISCGDNQGRKPFDVHAGEKMDVTGEHRGETIDR